MSKVDWNERLKNLVKEATGKDIDKDLNVAEQVRKSKLGEKGMSYLTKEYGKMWLAISATILELTLEGLKEDDEPEELIKHMTAAVGATFACGFQEGMSFTTPAEPIQA